MRIAFVTSGLEPGRDGVGDYVRNLAGECIRRGHDVRAVALNDRFCTQERDALSLRLGEGVSWSERIAQAKQYMDEFEPDFASLQFVCYGFHRRGLDLGLPGKLKRLLNAPIDHLFFHELWIGAELGASLKARILGALQRRCIVRLVRDLAPKRVQTSNPAYRHLLSGIGVAADVLPLFGNIPIIDAAQGHRAEGWHFIMFGAVPPKWPAEPLLPLLLASGKNISITHVGRIGAGQAVWDEMVRCYGDRIRFKRAGEQPAERVSQLLKEADFGVATVPWALVGKSGSVAAMIEHGLPVVVNRDDVRIPGFVEQGPPEPQLLRMGVDLVARLEGVKQGLRGSRLPAIADQFLAQINGARG